MHPIGQVDAFEGRIAGAGAVIKAVGGNHRGDKAVGGNHRGDKAVGGNHALLKTVALSQYLNENATTKVDTTLGVKVLP